MATKKKSRSSGAKKSRPKVKKKKGGAKPASRPAEISVFDPDRVTEVFDVMPDEDMLAEAADRLSGLAHPSRLKAIVALSVHELCVGDIAAILGLSLSATSTLLKQLRALGYVSARGAGKQTYYRMASTLPETLLSSVFASLPPA